MQLNTSRLILRPYKESGYDIWVKNRIQEDGFSQDDEVLGWCLVFA